MRKQWIRTGALYSTIILAGIILAFVMMICVYSLPLDHMKEHARESAEMLQKEGDYPSWADSAMAAGDQFTDAIMIKAAVLDTEKESLIERAMLVPYTHTVAQVDGIPDAASDNPSQSYQYYPRYWHGYLTVLKPLLLFFNVSEIRILSMIVQLALLFYVLMLIRDRLGWFYSLAFLAAVLFLNPISIILSMQYKNIYYITLISTAVLIKLNQKGIEDKYAVAFLINGMSVAFFDFLTYPLVALCIPLTVYLVLCGGTVTSKMKESIKRCFAWAVGYGTMWMGKWLLASILTGQNVIKDGIDRTAYRASGEFDGTQIGLMDILKKNLIPINNPVFILLFVLIVTGILVYAVRKKQFTISSKVRKAGSPYKVSAPES